MLIATTAGAPDSTRARDDMPSDEIATLARAFSANERDAHALAGDLSEALGTWRSHPGSWSVAECLDHLAIGNRVYPGPTPVVPLSASMSDARTRERDRVVDRRGSPLGGEGFVFVTERRNHGFQIVRTNPPHRGYQ